MRLAPVAMSYATNPDEALRFAAESSRTTHGASTAVDACRYFAGLIVGALNGVTKDELLSTRYCLVPGAFDADPLAPEIDAVARGSFKEKEPPAIRGTGYVVDGLEAALWAFRKSDDFRTGCLLAVNLGDDADATGAVYGQIAGACYGEQGIPAAWREKIAMGDLIASFAVAFQRKGV
jgi:ADP-ribosyl-[dinitrogen reductase] hydrolase